MNVEDVFWLYDKIEFSSCPVNFLPVLLICNNLPYKLIYSENKTLRKENYPTLSQICKVFQQNPYKVDLLAVGMNKEGKENLAESDFFLEIQFSRYLIIQAHRDEKLEKVFHKIEFKSTHYNSFTLLARGEETIINDEITVEKQLYELTSGITDIFEKASKTVHALTLQFFVDRHMNISYEWPYEWSLSILIEEKGIRDLPIVFSSFQKVARSDIKTYSLGLKPRPIQAKPRVQFKEKKFSQTKLHLSLLSFSQKLTRPISYCNGNYCDLKIQTINKRSKKVSLYLYQTLAHPLIRATVLTLTYPASESEFDAQFKRNFKTNQTTSLQPSENCPLSLKQNNITLCPTCFKVFKSALSNTNPI